MSMAMVHETNTSPPPILLSIRDYNRLADLARTTLARFPADDAQLLLEELHRADIVPTDEIPPDVVKMNSHVEFRDDRTGTVRRVQLVYPYQANIKEGRISVLSLVGAALIGLGEHQPITWRARNGGERRLTVLRASAEPFSDDFGMPRADQTSAPSQPSSEAASCHEQLDQGGTRV
jgi:regulator of nucleoside diphosphate kinase